jgi:hypothetical protein
MQLTRSLKGAWFQPLSLCSEKLVSKFAGFKLNLYRYIADKEAIRRLKMEKREVGLCTLNQVDPQPITYSLSNP